MPVVLRTVLLKIWHPSRRTRAVIYRTLRAYTNATVVVLEAVARDWDIVKIEGMRGGRLDTHQLASILSRRYRRRTTPYPLHSSLRDALFPDLAATLVAYDTLCVAWLAKRDQVAARFVAEGWSIDPLSPLDRHTETLLAELGNPPAWPTIPRTRPDLAGFDAALANLSTSMPDLTETVPSANSHTLTKRQQRLRELLTLMPGPHLREEAPRGVRLTSLIATGSLPLSFPRADGATRRRNMALLHADRHGRYSALVYLLPGDDPHRRPLRLPDDVGVITAVHPTRVPIAGSDDRPSSALRLDLACGEWQARTALAPALQDPEMIRVAKLIHRPAHRTIHGMREESYYLALTVAHQTPKERSSVTHLAVAQANGGSVGWAVIDPGTGATLATGTFDEFVNLQGQHRQERRAQARVGRVPPRAHHVQAAQVKAAIHRLANHLVALADEHCAQVGVVDTTYLRSRQPFRSHGGSSRRAARTSVWHETFAERNYRHAMLMSSALTSALSHKLPRVGLPRPVTLRGIALRLCAHCGAQSDESAICTACGESLGATNTAIVAARAIALVLARTRNRRQEEVADNSLEIIEKS